jgi:hypothetical protein
LEKTRFSSCGIFENWFGGFIEGGEEEYTVDLMMILLLLVDVGCIIGKEVGYKMQTKLINWIHMMVRCWNIVY